MGKKLYPTDTLEQAQDMLVTWNMVDPSLTFGSLNAKDLEQALESVRTLEEKIGRLQKELMEIRSQRDTISIGIWSTVKRARAGFKAIYGDDSYEYKIAGGTPLSDRRSPRRASPERPKEGEAILEQAK